MHLKVSSGKCRQFCLSLNVLNNELAENKWEDIIPFSDDPVHQYITCGPFY